MVVGASSDGRGEALAEFALQEANYLSDPLQGKATAAELANDGDLGEILHGVEAAVPFPGGYDDAAFVPPLQLARRDASQVDDFTRCECLLHSASKMFKTNTL